MDDGDIQYAERYAVDPGAPVSREFLEAAEVVMVENNLHIPLSVDKAFDFYLELKHFLAFVIQT